jgi:hypothetical protein
MDANGRESSEKKRAQSLLAVRSSLLDSIGVYSRPLAVFSHPQVFGTSAFQRLRRTARLTPDVQRI